VPRRNTPPLKFLKRHIRVAEGLRGNGLSARETGTKAGQLERFTTPLFLALVLLFIGARSSWWASSARFPR
jgi:tellurite resistance protein TerC